MKHTKGKWFWVGENLRTKQQDDKSWQGTLVFHHTASKEETKANRDLIASAPDMLEILNELKPIVDKILYNHREYSYIDGIDFSYLGDNLDKCLAKAEGNEKNK